MNARPALGKAVLGESPMAKPAKYDPSASMVSPDAEPEPEPEPEPGYPDPTPVPGYPELEYSKPDPCCDVAPVTGVE